MLHGRLLLVLPTALVLAANSRNITFRKLVASPFSSWCCVVAALSPPPAPALVLLLVLLSSSIVNIMVTTTSSSCLNLVSSM